MADQDHVDTPDQNKDPNASGTGSDTPTGEKSPTVDDLKNEVEREKARAATALREKDEADKRARDEKLARIKAEKALAEAGGGGNGGGNGNGSQANTSEDQFVRNSAERDIAMLLATTPAYQELLSKDPTLKEIMTTNPLSLIREYIDAEDAVEQLKKKLDSRVSANSSDTTTTTKSKDGEPEKKPEIPPANGGGSSASGKMTAAEAAKLSPEEWGKLPEAERRRILEG